MNLIENITLQEAMLLRIRGYFLVLQDGKVKRMVWKDGNL